jgi:hypothetical protein
MLIGFFVWGDMPTVALLAGSGIVVGSGLFLLWHEARQKAQPGSTAAPTLAPPMASVPSTRS